MGQATVSPDPLDESTTTTSIASADDLLAQLAGEEIDRLLAESEAERAATPAAPPAPPAAPATAPAVVPVTPAVAPELFHSRDVVVSERPVEADRAVTAQPELTAAPQAAPLAPSAPTPPAPAVSGAPAPSVRPALVEPQEPDGNSIAAAERAALTEAAPATNASAARVETESDPSELALDEPRPLPLLLRPLEWLNAPLASCPETLRETLGKVAIVTLVNAVAVLAYVLMFRRQ